MQNHDEQFEEALALIQDGRFDEARFILRKLSSSQAWDLLQRIEIMEPPTDKRERKKWEKQQRKQQNDAYAPKKKKGGYDRVREYLAAGDFANAEKLLRTLDGQEADELREQLVVLRQQYADLEEKQQAVQYNNRQNDNRRHWTSLIVGAFAGMWWIPTVFSRRKKRDTRARRRDER